MYTARFNIKFLFLIPKLMHLPNNYYYFFMSWFDNCSFDSFLHFIVTIHSLLKSRINKFGSFVLVLLLFGLIVFLANLWIKIFVGIILRNSKQRKWKYKCQRRIALLQELTLELVIQQLRVLHSGFDLSPIFVISIVFFSM